LSRWVLTAAALAIGVSVTATEQILFSLLTGRPLVFASDVEPVVALIAAIPYLALALVGARSLLPWIIGLTLTLSLWGYALYSGVRYQWNPDGTGADIGLGLIMLASPFVFTPIVLGVHAWQRRRGAMQTEHEARF
jgi:hypothetical protein